MIRPSIVAAIVRREIFEIIRNRTLLLAIVLPPVILIALPIIAAAVDTGKHLSPQVIQNLVAARPEWADFTPKQLASAFGLQQMQFVFLLMPATVPLAIASYSIVGEKQTRSLEAVLATPVETRELLARRAGDLKGKAEDALQDAKELIRRKKADIATALEAGKEAVQQAKQSNPV